MTDDEIGVRLRLLDKQRFIRDTKDGSAAVTGIGKSAEDAGRRSSRAFGLMRGGLLNVARAAKYGAAVGIGALVIEAKRSVEAFEESRKVGAQTDAVLRSTGGGANVSRKEIDALTDSLSRKTGLDDEAIQGAQNLLLTFRAIRNETGRNNDVFTQTVPVIADMAAAMGMDLNSAALQLGKALNNPEKGMTRLQRVGIEFTEQQQKQIEKYTELGDVQGAQRVMLDELTKQFGGSAEAQATALDRLGVSIGNIEESFGAMLAPAVDGAAKAIDDFLVDAQPELDRISGRIEGVFAKDNLDLGEKFMRSARLLRREAEPFADEFRELLDDADLGERFKQAIIWAAPKIADGMAAAAPKAAEAFVASFQNAGPWGRLLTLAFLGSKLGAFTPLGRMASEQFFGGFGRHAQGPGATTVATNTGLGVQAQNTKWAAAGRLAGGIFATAMVAELGFESMRFLEGLNDKLEEEDGIAGAIGWLSNVGEDIASSPYNPATQTVQQLRDVMDPGWRDDGKGESSSSNLNPARTKRNLRNPGGGLGRMPGARGFTATGAGDTGVLTGALERAIRRGMRDAQPRVRVDMDGEQVGNVVARHDLLQRDRDGDD